MSIVWDAGTPIVRRWLLWGLAGAAVLWGLSAGLRDAWTCDDAYIVFRYARNLVTGAGLVFNPGERVEGFTDLLWVLWNAVAFPLGVEPETWANASSLAAYAATIALLAWDHDRLTKRLPVAAWGVVPVAALAAAAHPDWNVFATSGLETSAFTFLLVAGYVLLVGPRSRALSLGAGVVFALATLTRPDGALPAAIGGAFLLLRTRSVREAVRYILGFATLWLPATVFRWAYYGSIVPNTYWAKSANVAWWEQGARYAGLYFERYGVYVFAPVVVLLAVLTFRHEGGARREALRKEVWSRISLAAALAAGFTLYVMRVGGDFMYARMLIPATPFYLLVFELGWLALPSRTPVAVGLALAAVPVAVPALLPCPVQGETFVSGVANEHDFYDLKRATETDFRGDVLRPFFAGLPVAMFIEGAEVRLAYRAEARTVLEAHGLTDPVIARQPLRQRGRPGHERWPTADYVILTRKMHVTFGRTRQQNIFFGFVPLVPIRFGPVQGYLLRWDPAILSEWKRRGAVFPAFPAFLDAYEAEMGGKPDDVVRADYERFRHFYFQYVRDDARERPFRARLGLL